MSPRIFIVDDSDSNRELISEIVKNEGCSNLRSFSHPSAVIEAVSRGDHPSLVITDFKMPELSGVALLDNLLAFLPSVSGIIVTSDTYAALERTNSFPVLEKSNPGFYDQLVDSIRNSLKESIV